MQAFRAKAPLRISFGGGGTDVSPYTEQHGGAVLSTTINRFAYAMVRVVDTGRIRINSIDYDPYCRVWPYRSRHR